MDAAVKAATEAFLKAGQKAGDVAMKEAVVAFYLHRSKSEDALKFGAETLAMAGKVVSPSEALTFATVKDSSAKGLLTELSTGSVTKDSIPKCKDLVAAMQKDGNKTGEAYALIIIANAYIVSGDGTAAVKTAKQAFGILRSDGGNKAAEIPALKTLVCANFVKKDVDEAMRAASEVVKITMSIDDKKSGAMALSTLSGVYLASGEPGMAIKMAEEALALAKSNSDKDGQIAALSAAHAIHKMMGKPVAAQKAGKEVLGMVTGDAKAEAAANLLVADSVPGSKDSLEAAKKAVAGFKSAGDKAGEGAAMIAQAYAYLAQAQKQFDDGLESAKGAAAVFAGSGDKGGEGLAQAAVAFAYIAKEDAQEAEKAAKVALQLFQEGKYGIGEAYATNLASTARFAGMQPSQAKLFFDDVNCAHVELNECATQESLEAVVAMLHNWSSKQKGRDIRCIVMHLEGTPAPPKLQSYAMSSGAFILGLRSVGIPLVLCAWGKIAGPSWGLVLACDYRLAVQDTVFYLPIWGPPECLGDLVGQSTAAQLIMTSGTTNALSMLEAQVLNQAYPDKEHCQKGASEFAKRISSYPNIAIRQTMNLMCPAIEKYALAVGGAYS
jgi:tetratricopeptide (TPR) repeat protein